MGILDCLNNIFAHASFDVELGSFLGCGPSILWPWTTAERHTAKSLFKRRCALQALPLGDTDEIATLCHAGHSADLRLSCVHEKALHGGQLTRCRRVPWNCDGTRSCLEHHEISRQ